jgi:hypothetical protein
MKKYIGPVIFILITTILQMECAIAQPINFKQISKQLREGMTEDRVKSILGKPSSEKISTCGQAVNKPWECKSNTYTNDDESSELRIYFQKDAGQWIVNSWKAEDTGDSVKVLSCDLSGTSSPSYRDLKEIVTLKISKYGSRGGSGKEPEYFVIENPNFEFAAMRYPGQSKPPVIAGVTYNSYRDWSTENKYDFSYSEVRDEFMPIMSEKIQTNIKFQLDRRTGELIASIDKHLINKKIAIDGDESKSFHGICKKAPNKAQF